MKILHRGRHTHILIIINYFVSTQITVEFECVYVCTYILCKLKEKMCVFQDFIHVKICSQT